MSRPLALAIVQTEARAAARALEEYADEVLGIVTDFPRTQLIVHPEYYTCAIDGATPEERTAQYNEIAQPLDGPRVKGLGEIARAVGRWLLPGTVIERGPNGELWNTAVVFSPQGELVASYHKMFPWRPWEIWTPGREFVVFDIPDLGRFGLSICYDVWFPEVFRNLAWMGAEVIVNLFQNPFCDREQERVLARANAIVNQVFVITCNSYPGCGGASAVIDPEGRVRTDSYGMGQTLLTDCIDLDQVTLVRRWGTQALDTPWAQFNEDDPPIELPAYRGRLDPRDWNPARHRH